MDYLHASEKDLEDGREALMGGGVGGDLRMVVDHGAGASLFDKTGREYIDCTSQAWSLNVGYCHPKSDRGSQRADQVLHARPHQLRHRPETPALPSAWRAGARPT